MPAPRIHLTVKPLGYAGVSKRFTERQKVMRDAGREVLKQEGRELIKEMRNEAPEDTGAFKKGFRYTTRQKNNGEFTLTAFATGPHAFLMPMVVDGTKAHEIPTGGAAAQKAKGYPLKFFWHPGTQPNNFVRRALDTRRGPMREALRGYFWSSVVKVR